MSILTMQSTLSYLRFNLVWPPKKDELNPPPSYKIKFTIMILTTFFALVGSLFHLVVSAGIYKADIPISEDLIVATAEIGCIYFLIVYFLYQNRISKVYLQLSTFLFEKPPTFDDLNARLTLFSKFYKTFIDSVIITYFLEPPFVKHKCVEVNKSREFQDFCGMVVPIWLPFDFTRSPVREIFYVWQTYCLLFTLKGAACVSFIVMETLEHLVVRVKHFKVMVKEAINTEDEQLLEKRLTNCIKYHESIFKLGREIDESHAECLFVHGIFTGILFGIIAYSILNVGLTLNTLSLWVGWFLALALVSVSGQHLLDESSSVAEAIYFSRWYERDLQVQKKILFMLMRTSRPIKIRAGPFSHLSHVLIFTILKTAYSYTTVLSRRRRHHYN